MRRYLPMRKISKPSLLQNTAINYAGQAYAMLVGILIQPFYLGHLGAETYGLIGFFAVLQTWLQLLDVGISGSLVREIAHSQGQSNSKASSGRQLLRSLECLFIPISASAFISIYTGSAWISQHWLDVRALDPATVTQCVGLMGLMISLRLLATLYKSGVQGLELHGWINAVNVLIATLRYFGGLALVIWYSQDALDFFLFQAAIALAEMLIFAMKAYSLLPGSLLLGFNWERVKPLVPFAASMSLTSILWIALTQLDKLVLSKVLPLGEYGYFSLVALISTGIFSLTNPLVQALLPRMTVLLSEGQTSAMENLYRNAARFAAALLLPLAGVIAVHGEALVYAWTGDTVSAKWCGPILFWYALGAALLALSQFQFYLQYIHGQLRLHVIYSLVSAAISIPVVVLSIFYWGAYGAALAWFVLRSITFVIWAPVVHARFAPGLHKIWQNDLLLIVAGTILGLLVSKVLYNQINPTGRFTVFLTLMLGGTITLCSVALSMFASAPKQALSRIFSRTAKLND